MPSQMIDQAEQFAAYRKIWEHVNNQKIKLWTSNTHILMFTKEPLLWVVTNNKSTIRKECEKMHEQAIIQQLIADYRHGKGAKVRFVHDSI